MRVSRREVDRLVPLNSTGLATVSRGFPLFGVLRPSVEDLVGLLNRVGVIGGESVDPGGIYGEDVVSSILSGLAGAFDPLAAAVAMYPSPDVEEVAEALDLFSNIAGTAPRLAVASLPGTLFRGFVSEAYWSSVGVCGEEEACDAVAVGLAPSGESAYVRVVHKLAVVSQVGWLDVPCLLDGIMDFVGLFRDVFDELREPCGESVPSVQGMFFPREAPEERLGQPQVRTLTELLGTETTVGVELFGLPAPVSVHLDFGKAGIRAMKWVGMLTAAYASAYACAVYLDALKEKAEETEPNYEAGERPAWAD